MAGRFLKILSEEESFWMMTSLFEQFVPLDYYSKMFGVLLDTIVFDELLHEAMPELVEFLQENFIEPKTFSFQWFSCLFSYNFSWEVLSKIWDMLFLKGTKILFRVSLAILHLIKKTLMSRDGIEEIMKDFDNIPLLI
jgi:hypothetical protein